MSLEADGLSDTPWKHGLPSRRVKHVTDTEQGLVWHCTYKFSSVFLLCAGMPRSPFFVLDGFEVAHLQQKQYSGDGRIFHPSDCGLPRIRQ